MKEYHDHEPRLTYKSCPGCRADLEQEAAECLFCDHQFVEEVYAEELEPHEFPENESSSMGNMVALNVALSLLGAILPAWESLPEQRSEVPSYRMSATDREELLEYHKRIAARRDSSRRSCALKCDAQTRACHEWLLSLTDSDQQTKRPVIHQRRF